MDRRELRRLKDQIDKGTLDAGIYKIEDPKAFKKEGKLPAYKGAGWGFSAGAAVALIYTRSNSPLGFYAGNMTLVFILCVGFGTAIGALLMWQFSRWRLKEKNPPNSN
jgi:hypothetical protein